MAISDSDISGALLAYLESYPEEAAQLSEPMRLLRQGEHFAARRTYPMHVTVGALVVRGGAEILLIDHLAYGITLQPGGHLEPGDTTLIGAVARELSEETGLDPGKVALMSPSPAYIEFGEVPARPAKGEPAHFHLDFGFAFSTAAEVGVIQESEVTGAAWYPLAAAERLVGPRIARAINTPRRQRVTRRRNR
ncbi:NUDIX hydrolase [Nocardia sp. CA-151230]|uniref:NUDIX hydrolase n=1 Tax=Nocardia sp. CA-151230 TaxID=3239982 RepID=UPI003D92C2BA